MTERIKQAESLLKNHKVACVLISSNSGIVESQKNGIMPLLEWLSKSPELLKGACAADKVVGKAAALLMIYGGVSEIYAEVISESAADCLEQNGIKFSFGKRVPYIRNRNKTDMCPMEKRCLHINSPDEAYEALSQMVMGRSRG